MPTDPTMTLPAHEFVRAFRADPDLQARPQAAARHEALTARSSVCSFCGVGCPYTVEADARGRDRVAPLSGLGLCVKGQTSLLTGGDDERTKRLARRGIADDRIRAPMIRGHDGKMKVVSWEEALDRAAWLFLHTREWVGPGAVGLYGNGQKTLEAIWIACLYKLVFDLPTIGANSEHCLASAGAAHELNFGNEAAFTWQEFDELARCDVAVLHGTNAFITFPQAYEKLKANPHPVKVVIDPVRTDTVSDMQGADPRTLHIRFRPGGDVAFNLAVARTILEQGWQDQAYLDRAVDPDSLAALRALCMQPRHAPEAVAARIALPDQDPAALAATIRQYAALLAQPSARTRGERPRVAIVSSMGINQSTGSYGFSTNLNLLLLTGNVGRPGAGSLRIAGQSNATSELMMGLNSRRLVFNLRPEDPEHRQRLAEALDLPVGNIPARVGTAVSEMADDDHLYCFLFVGTQMTRNMPRLGHWMRRLGRSFNIVIDPFLADGVLEWADVLLPSLTYTERTGVIQRGDRTLQLQQGLTAAPDLAWSDTKILTRLALRIAERLRDPDTAALNDLDPDVVHRAFARYVDAEGDVDNAVIFDHLVETSRALDLYSRLEDADGQPISHDRIRQRAGQGVQWQGDGRYAGARDEGEVFPRSQRTDRGQARLVRPPDGFLDNLEAACADPSLILISGRGRPGRRGRTYRARYNSGIKTLPLHGASREDYHVELHPDAAAAQGLAEGQAVRLVSGHGAAIAAVSLNDRVPRGLAYIDFVPGEINRLTDYIDADRFTNQSLIKRTPVRLTPLAPLEEALWAAPDPAPLAEAVGALYDRFCATYPEGTEGWESLQRAEDGAADWLPPGLLRSGAEPALAEAAGAMACFIQRYTNDDAYHARGVAVIRALPEETRDRFLCILLPLLRALDYQSAFHTLLNDFVGSVTVVKADGSRRQISLRSAHKSAILEFKEEIVAIQLYVAIQRGLVALFGADAEIEEDDLAFVSGIAIPCAGDVPAHFVGISPAELGSGRLIHARAIGMHAIMVVDRKRNRAVRVNVHTGILPRDRELTQLRGTVIAAKKVATAWEHRRFFDRLGELIARYVRLGDGNFHLYGPEPLDWGEFHSKLSYAPARRSDFRNHLLASGVSAGLGRSLMALGILDEVRDAPLLRALPAVAREGDSQAALSAVIGDDGLPFVEKVERVVEHYIAPVLRNDGGKLELLSIDEPTGRLTVRFVGSCANCPYSLLSMEQLVKPTLLSIPGVNEVIHRARARKSEIKMAHASAESPPARQT